MKGFHVTDSTESILLLAGQVQLRLWSRPCARFMELLDRHYSIGMRCETRFDGGEAPEQRFTGTIVEVSDADPTAWPESKWPSLKVNWDKDSSIPSPEWVSPWQIELALLLKSHQRLNKTPYKGLYRPKRRRPPKLVLVIPTSWMLLRNLSSFLEFTLTAQRRRNL